MKKSQNGDHVVPLTDQSIALLDDIKKSAGAELIYSPQIEMQIHMQIAPQLTLL
jgi:hypothetical protein